MQSKKKNTQCTWLPEHSEAISVMASLCSSNTSDRVMLLPLEGTSNTRTAPDETPGYQHNQFK